MPYTTTELITGAYYSSQIVAREFETVNGGEIHDGLIWLNDILAEKEVDDSSIPYESSYNSNFVTGQQTYFIPNLIKIDTLTFFINDVRYPMEMQKRNEYFGSARTNNIKSLPSVYNLERVKGGANLSVYYFPDQPYPFEIKGVFQLQEVALGQDLSLTIPRFYRTYLRLALADRICSEYSETTPEDVMRQLSKYEGWISKKSRVLDLRLQKTSTLMSRQRGINYAFVNLNEGYWPSS